MIMKMTPEERKAWRQKLSAITDDEFMAMDETEFRARFRERLHHRLEIQTYAAAYRKQRLNPTQADYAKRLVGIWEKRGLPLDAPEYRFAKTLIGFADCLARGEQIDLSAFAPAPVTPQEAAAFTRILMERRSVREFKSDTVPDELIDKILNAGLWAAHACNLQSIRYLVVRESKVPGMFRGSDVPGGPVHLVICQDMRVYRANRFMPEKNILLDAGAAGQNIVLAAYAYGLDSVWLTFNETSEIRQRLREYFKLPDYIEIVTYIDVGYGDQTPCPPYRQSVEDCIIGRTPLE